MSIPPEKIIELAEKSGFDSELKASFVLKQSEWGVTQNIYYIDKDESKGRELDIQAHKFYHDLDIGPEVHCGIELCIEVKKTSEPFIFFSSEANFIEPGSGYGILNWKNKVDRHILSYQDIEKDKPFAKPQRLARSYCAFKDAKSHQIKSGILSAVKAAVYNREKCNEIYSDKSHDIWFFVPVLVVDGDIFECHFSSETNNLVTEKVESIVYVQNYLSENYGKIAVSVPVISLNNLAKFSDEYKTWAKSITDTMREKEHLYKG